MSRARVLKWWMTRSSSRRWCQACPGPIRDRGRWHCRQWSHCARQNWLMSRVDVIVLDVEMPGMDGLEVLRELRHQPIASRAIMFPLTPPNKRSDGRGGPLGAADCVAKPSSLAGSSRRAECGTSGVSSSGFAPRANRGGRSSGFVRRQPRVHHPAASPARTLEVVAIGASTGGPNALCQLFASLPGAFPCRLSRAAHARRLHASLAGAHARKSKLVVEEGYEGGKLERRPSLAGSGRGGTWWCDARQLDFKPAGPVRRCGHVAPPWTCSSVGGRPAVAARWVRMTAWAKTEATALAIRRAGARVIIARRTEQRGLGAWRGR